MIRKTIVLLLAAALLALAGCGTTPTTSSPATTTTPEPTKAAEPVTITYWNTYSPDSPENKWFTGTVIPAFNKKYPNITVNSVNQAYDGLHDSLVTAAAGGTTPDVMRMDIIWVPEFAKLGALEALDSYAGFGAIKDTTFPGVLATTGYKGKYYGLPLNTNTQVIVYSKEYLKAAGLSAAPKTIEEFQKYAATFKGQKDKAAFAPGGAYPWAMLPWFWSLGGKITNADYTKATGFLNSDDSVAALQTLLDLNKDGAFAGTLLGGQPGTWDGYKAGKYGAVLEGPWFYSTLLNDKDTAQSVKDNMVSGQLPAGKGGSISVTGGEDIVIFKASKNKDAAWKFVQFMLSDEVQGTLAKAGMMSVTKAGSASQGTKDVTYLAAFADQLATAMPRTPVPAYTKIDGILSTHFEAAFRGKETAKDALTKAAAEIDPLLGQ